MLKGFVADTFAAEGAEFPIYRRGSGPGVIVLSEIPGITPAVAGFAAQVADAGFTVVVPELFGQTGKAPSPLYVAKSISGACISREFSVLSTRRSSPVTSRLRALARELHAELGGPGVGAIGMCLTGNFALSMMLEPAVIAPVLSQPSLPFPFTPRQKRALHLSAKEKQVVTERSRKEGIPVLALRFTGDRLCPKQRFNSLRQEFGERLEAIEIDSSRGNPYGNSTTAHSVLTEDLVDETGHPTRIARDRVLEFLKERLVVTSA